MRARYQNPAVGRFESEDPVFWEIGQTKDGVAVLGSPQAQNSYTYANNSPVVNKDPDGRCGTVCVALWGLITPNIAYAPAEGEEGYTNTALESSIFLAGFASPSRGLTNSLTSRTSGWLLQHELKGGHTIARHVGKTDAWLTNRLANNPTLTQASTFTNTATAENVISQTISSNRADITNWLRNNPNSKDFALTFEGTKTIGRTADSSGVTNSTNANIVLQRSSDGKSYYVKTAYPTKPKPTKQP